MTMIETVFILGLVLGFLFSLKLASWWVLSRLHRDDVEEAHAKYRKRKEKYL
jgi:hypothetical protein